MTIFGLGLLLWLLGMQMSEIRRLDHVLSYAAKEAAEATAADGVSLVQQTGGAPAAIDPDPSNYERAASTSLSQLHREVLAAAEPRGVPSWIRDQAAPAVPPARPEGKLGTALIAPERR